MTAASDSAHSCFFPRRAWRRNTRWFFLRWCSHGSSRAPSRHPRVVREVLLTTVVAVILAAVLLSMENYRALVSHSLADQSIGTTLLANGRAIPEMFSLWVRPWALSADHEFDSTDPSRSIDRRVVVLIGLAAAALAFRRHRPMLALAIAWSLIALLPTNSVLTKSDLVTEKPLYLAWVGPSMALGWALPVLLGASRVAAHGECSSGPVASCSALS